MLDFPEIKNLTLVSKETKSVVRPYLIQNFGYMWVYKFKTFLVGIVASDKCQQWYGGGGVDGEGVDGKGVVGSEDVGVMVAMMPRGW